MSLPSKSELEALSYSFDGSPFCQVSGSSTVTGNGLDYSIDGSPFWFITATPSGYKMYVGANQVTAMYIGENQVTVAYLGENSLL